MPSITRIVLIVAVLVTLVSTTAGVAAALPPKFPGAANDVANKAIYNGFEFQICLTRSGSPQVCGPALGYSTSDATHMYNGPDE